VAGEFRAVPKLQAHMTAIQRKVVELERFSQDKIERGLVKRMFDKFQCIIAEFANRVEALRRNIEETATMEEISTLLQDVLNSLHSKSETAIGQIRCMACRREMVKVTRAVPEEDAERALGQPLNSIIIPSQTSSTSVSYSSRLGFDSAITESPKSKRSSRLTAT
jgi:Mg2+ and Co2+ transporter CorA